MSTHIWGQMKKSLSQTTSLATTVHLYPALLSPRAVTLSMDQLPFISGGKVSFRVRMPSATSLGLPLPSQ
ncbi:hypothetical protein [Marinomonas spartinae]|uniref:hypothetical protein n=1 Tax=Marinomonas spartinae TaxID=1792290 RepID=UPI0020C8CB3E|nr:hypothetical protein [Marinomonas spartinae]